MPRKVPPFLRKLHQILHCQKHSEIVSFLPPDFSAFRIASISSFTHEIMPLYFKHSNYSSFVRQLNIYGFGKVRREEEGEVWGRDGWKQGENIENIARKDRKKRNNSFPDGDVSESEIALSAYLTPALMFPSNALVASVQPLPSTPLSTLQNSIILLKQKQKVLKEFCFALLSQNKSLQSQNIALRKSLLQSSSKQHLINRLSAFVANFLQEEEQIEQQNQQFAYYESILNLINYLEQTEHHTFFFAQLDDRAEDLFHRFIDFIESNSISFVFKSLAAYMQNQQLSFSQHVNLVRSKTKKFIKKNHNHQSDYHSALIEE